MMRHPLIQPLMHNQCGASSSNTANVETDMMDTSGALEMESEINSITIGKFSLYASI